MSHDPKRAPRPGDMLSKHYKVSRSGYAEARLVLDVSHRKPDCLTRIVYRDHTGGDHKVSRSAWIRWAKEAMVHEVDERAVNVDKIEAEGEGEEKA